VHLYDLLNFILMFWHEEGPDGNHYLQSSDARIFKLAVKVEFLCNHHISHTKQVVQLMQWSYTWSTWKLRRNLGSLFLWSKVAGFFSFLNALPSQIYWWWSEGNSCAFSKVNSHEKMWIFIYEGPELTCYLEFKHAWFEIFYKLNSQQCVYT
jgi:hypothetical protein